MLSKRKRKNNKNAKQDLPFYATFVLIAIAVIGIVTGSSVQAVDEPPYDVTWSIENFYSDTYNLEDISLIWSGDTGSATDLEVSGGSNGGALDTTYTTAGEYTVLVYAENSSGDQVSNTAICRAAVGCLCPNGFVCVGDDCVPELGATCAAYATPVAENPQLFFGPGEDVYWRAAPTGGDAPYSYNWNDAADGYTTQIAGPYAVGVDYTYAAGPIYTADVNVFDDDGNSVNAACSVSIKECNTDVDCPSGEICRLDDFTCGPLKPVFIEPLDIDPGIVNEGQLCTLDWEIEGAFLCEVYRNGELFDSDAPTTTPPTSYNVQPGSYNLHCENELEEAIDAGPARCLLNPQLREQ